MGVATATALVGTGLSAFQTINSAKEKKDAEKEKNAYQVFEPTNAAENISLASGATDIMRDESARNTATMVDALRNAGPRGIAQIPRLQANANKVNQDIGLSYLERDEKRKYAVARGEEKIMDWKVNRDNNNLSAISSQYNAANENFNKGLWGVASGISSTMRGLETDKDNGSTWFNKET